VAESRYDYPAWSNDSSRIALGRDNCEEIARAETCTHELVIWNIETQSVEARLDLTSYQKAQRLTSCDYVWSPDSQWIAFRINCNSLDSQDPIKEIFLWNVRQNTYRQVTNFTMEALQHPGSQVSANFAIHWKDLETLWIGANYTIAAENYLDVGHTTIAYNVSTTVTTPLSNDGVAEWAFNPITDALTVLMEPRHIDSLGDMGAINYIENVRPSVQASEAEEILTNPDKAIGAGCNIDWSPDGVQLGYLMSQGDPSCRYGIEAIVVTHPQTGEISRVSIPEAERDFIRPIGWLPPIG
jgi:hypothetical protein